MSITVIKDINKEIINSITTNILIAGSREQSKTEIMIKRLVQDLDNNLISCNQVIFFVVDDKQVSNLYKKLAKESTKYADKIAILKYQDFFYKLYTLLHFVHEIPNNLVNMNVGNMSDIGKIMNLMEIVYSQLDMDFGQFPMYKTWGEYVNFTYNYKKVNIDKGKTKQQKKLFAFLIKFHLAMLDKKLITDHGMINQVLRNISNDKRVANLAHFMNGITHIYCDDVHFLTKKEWKVLTWLIKWKLLKYIMSCDLYYLPERLIDLEDNKVGVDFALQQIPIEIMKLNTVPTLTNIQKKVYALLTNAMSPIVPISKVKNQITEEDIIDGFKLSVTNMTMPIVKSVLEIVKFCMLENKTVAVFQDNFELLPLIEAFAIASGLAFYKKTRNTFWTNPHNSFLSCYVSFLNNSCNAIDISFFFENIIPNYKQFEEKASLYLKIVIEKGFDKVNIHDFIDISKKGELFFFNSIKDLTHISNLLKNDFEMNKGDIFANQWVKKYALVSPDADLSSSTYLNVLTILLKYMRFGNLSEFCKFLSILEDREFYNPSTGFLISDRDLFDYSNYDRIIVVTKSNNIGQTLDSQSQKTHSLLYQLASSFNEKLHVFVENRRDTSTINSFIDDFIKTYK